MKRQRQPEIGRPAHAHSEKLRRHHTDDGEGRAVKQYTLAHYAGIAVQFLRPIAVADHRRRLGRRIIVIICQDSSLQGVDSQNRKVVSRNQVTRRTLDGPLEQRVSLTLRRLSPLRNALSS